MQNKQIVLNFGEFSLEAELFDSSIAEAFAENMPYTVSLTQWGNELYGPIGIDLGEENPLPEIPEGGIAYTNRGNYLCVFFGQMPAWPVEYIGQVKGGSWNKLVENPLQNSMVVKIK